MTAPGFPSAKTDQTSGRQPACMIAVGLGNLLRSDDGVGVHAIRKLQTDPRLPRLVQVIEGGTLGLNLLPALHGVTHLLALDAVDTGNPPGALSRFGNADLDGLPVAKSIHLLGFADVLSSLRLLGQAPAQVTLLGIQPESTEWGLNLSPAVAAALDKLIEAALVQLREWKGAADAAPRESHGPRSHSRNGLHTAPHETERIYRANANAP